MNNKIIDLTLRNIEKRDKRDYSFKEIIINSNIIVILGPPGSGKTSILKKAQNDLKKEVIKNIEIRVFLKRRKIIKEIINEKTQALFLDGLDEYRNGAGVEKENVLLEIGDKLEELLEILPNLRVVITCREMEWNDKIDRESLNECLKLEKIQTYKICPLDEENQRKLLRANSVENINLIMEKFSNKGFFSNPQLLKMILEIKEKGEKLETKKDIYESFLNSIKENNIKQKKGMSLDDIENEEKKEILGYLAYIYIFSGIKKFDNDVINEIKSDENGYTKEKIKLLLGSCIFDNRAFIHRTIAEYALARYIITSKYKTEREKISLKKMFITDGRIRTELKGTYAWICSFSENEELIEVDSYYQLLNGDNSRFPVKLKLKVMENLKKINERKINDSDLKIKLSKFYEKEMDDVLLKGLKLFYLEQEDSFYGNILKKIIEESEDVSERIKDFVREVILNKEIKNIKKIGIIDVMRKDYEFLFNVLNKIKKGEIQDENSIIKNRLLYFLYPNYIQSNEIINWLNLEKNDEEYYFLSKTLREERKEIVIGILEKLKSKKKIDILDVSISNFIRKYYFELILESKNMKELYIELMIFKSYYKKYNPIEVNSNETNSKLKFQKEKISDKLFELFLSENLNKKIPIKKIYLEFKRFYDYTEIKNEKKVIFDVLEQKEDLKEKELLFQELVLRKSEKIEFLQKKYGFKKTNIKREFICKWENEYNKGKNKSQEKIRKSMEEKINYFKGKSNDEIANNFKVLDWIRKELETENKSLNKETTERLRRLMKNIIFENIKDEKLSIEFFLDKKSKTLNLIYKLSLNLNVDFKKIKNLKRKKIEYLYLVSIYYENNFFSEYYENINGERCKEIIKIYILGFLGKEERRKAKIILQKLTQEKSLEKLKEFVKEVRLKKNILTKRALYRNIYINYLLFFSIKELKILLEKNDDEMIKWILIFKEEEGNLKLEKNKEFKHIIIFFLERYGNKKRLLKNRKLKLKVIIYLIKQYDSKGRISYFSWNFRIKELFDLLEIEELKELYLYIKTEKNKKKILNYIDEREQLKVDGLNEEKSIENLKAKILKNSIRTQEDFFEEIILNLKGLKKEIEANRNNILDAFYNVEEKLYRMKSENECSDLIVNFLNQRFINNQDIQIIDREKAEGKNRVDINVRGKKEKAYEVQIECKKDKNKDVFCGIENQLIKKYLVNKVKYGIYLVFYNGDRKKTIKEMKDRLEAECLDEYKKNIEIIFIDFRRNK